MHKALIVDCQPLTDLLIGDELESCGFSCQSAPDNRAAMSLLSGDRSWNLLVTELHSANGGLGGIELGRLARTLHAKIRVLYLSEAQRFPAKLARSEYLLQEPYEIEDLHAALEALGLNAPQPVPEPVARPAPARAEPLVGQQPTGWRIDLSSRQATRGDVVLGYNVVGEGRLQVTILSGGGDDEANCLIAGDAIAEIEAQLRR